MKRIRREREVSAKRTLRFVRRVPALALAGAILMGGMTANAVTLEDVFDAKQYAEDYADLKAAFGDDEKALLNHYLTYGIAEGRQVSGLIDVVAYREKYADLDAAFGDDWNAYVEHYLTYGIYEGRDSGTDFDALDYADRYADLQEAFGNDVLALYKHYLTHGKTENREARSEKVVVAERHAAAAATNSTATPAANTTPATTDTPSTGSASAPTTTPSGDADSNNTSDMSMAEAILDLVNAEREKEGLTPLTLNLIVTDVAQLRSQEIVTVFEHTRPDGTKCFTALDQAGVVRRTAGENIAAGQPTPEAVMNSWMNSEGHRANILNADFTELGVGFTYVADDPAGYHYYWVQMFIGN